MEAHGHRIGTAWRFPKVWLLTLGFGLGVARVSLASLPVPYLLWFHTSLPLFWADFPLQAPASK